MYTQCDIIFLRDLKIQVLQAPRVMR